MAEVAAVFTKLISRNCMEDVDREAARDAGVKIEFNFVSKSAIIILTCCLCIFLKVRNILSSVACSLL